MRKIAVTVLVFLAGFSVSHTAVFSVDPRASYLHRESDPGAVSAEIIDLASIGFFPGDFVRIEALGDFSNGSPDDILKWMAGVFSRSEFHR